MKITEIEIGQDYYVDTRDPSYTDPTSSVYEWHRWTVIGTTERVDYRAEVGEHFVVEWQGVEHKVPNHLRRAKRYSGGGGALVVLMKDKDGEVDYKVVMTKDVRVLWSEYDESCRMRASDIDDAEQRRAKIAAEVRTFYGIATVPAPRWTDPNYDEQDEAYNEVPDGWPRALSNESLDSYVEYGADRDAIEALHWAYLTLSK